MYHGLHLDIPRCYKESVSGLSFLDLGCELLRRLLTSRHGASVSEVESCQNGEYCEHRCDKAEGKAEGVACCDCGTVNFPDPDTIWD